MRLLDNTGSLVLIGGYTGVYPGEDEATRQGRVRLPLSDIWAKKLTVGTGSHPGRRYSDSLKALILSEVARPGVVVSHHLPLAAAPEAYRAYDAREPGWVKAVLKP